MFTSSSQGDRRSMFAAACAVAIATAVSSPGANAASGTNAIGQIERYCLSSWRNAGIRRDDWEDCTQQALVELLEGVSTTGLETALQDSNSPERRELNRAVWRQTQRSRRAARCLHLDEGRPAIAAQSGGATVEEWNEVVQAGAGLLSDRQWTILERTRDGWRTAEIADELGIEAGRVSDEKYKAIAKLRQRLAELRGPEGVSTRSA